MDDELKTEQERIQAFADLRTKTLTENNRMLVERLKINPHLNEQEIQMGTFMELLEPQVRDAVIEMYRKGYEVLSSGFRNPPSTEQAIEGSFDLSEDTRSKFIENGVSVTEYPATNQPYQKYTLITFRTQEPDLSKIKLKWDSLVALLPELPNKARSMSFPALVFRSEFASGEVEKDIKQLQVWIDEGKFPPEQAEELSKKIFKLSSGQLHSYLYTNIFRKL